MLKFIVEFKDGHFYLKDSKTLLLIKEGASFEVKIAENNLKALPESILERHCMPVNTVLGFKVSGTEVQVQVEILEPLEFIFADGYKTVVNTHIRCRVSPLAQPFKSYPFEPFEAESLHDAYSQMSRKVKEKKIQHHNIHVANHFYVLTTKKKLIQYCESKKLFEHDFSRPC